VAIYFPNQNIQEVGGQLQFTGSQIVQIVETRSTATISCANWATENSIFSASITPTQATNKIHVYMFLANRMDAGAGTWSLAYMRLRVNATGRSNVLLIQSGWNGTWRNTIHSYQKTYVDSPGSTNTQTYTAYGLNYPTGTCYYNNTGQQNSDGYIYMRLTEVTA